jgi:hypothetical protein
MATDQPLSFTVRSRNVEVGILGAEIVVRAPANSWGSFLEFGLRGLLFGGGVREARIQLAVATAHYTGGVLRVYRLGQPWLILEGVDDHYVAIDFAEEVRRFNS